MAQEKKQIKHGNYSLPIEEMDLPIKLQIVLKKNNVNTLKQLASYDAFELMNFKNFGTKSISLVEKAIAKYGLRLGDFLRN